MSALPDKSKGGRPTKMTPPTIKKILRCVEKGMPLTLAANACGVTFQTLSTHRSNNPAFADALAGAVAKGVEARLKVIEDATNSPDESIRLRAACWFLEHTQPQHFARNRIEVTGAGGFPLAVGVGIYLPAKDTAPQSEIVNAQTLPADDEHE